MNIKKGNRGNRAKTELGCPWIRKIEKEHKEKRKKKEKPWRTSPFSPGGCGE